MMRMTETVKQLLIINIIFFVGSQFVAMANPMFSMFYPENPNFRAWQPITHMFMHGSVMHILFNMFALYSFGSTLEHFWGAKKFLFFYISCGIGAVLLHTGVNYYQYHHALTILQDAKVPNDTILAILKEGRYNNSLLDVVPLSTIENMYHAYSIPVVGASGAIYGLLIAFTFMFPDAELALMFIPIPVKAKYFVPVYMLLYDGFFGIFGNTFFSMGDDVAHYAHLGGALTGFIMMWYWKKNSFNKNRWN